MQSFLLVIGISLNDINELTLDEALNVIETYNKNKYDDYRKKEMIIYSSVAQVFNNKKTFKSIFEEKKAKTKKTKQQMQKEADELLKHFRR